MSNFEYRTTADIEALIKAQEVAEKYKAKNIKLGKSIRDPKRKAWFFPNTHEGARQDVAIYTQDKEVKEPNKATKNYKMYVMLNSGKTLREIGDCFDMKQGDVKSTLIKYCNKWGLKIDLPEEKTIASRILKLYKENNDIKDYEVAIELNIPIMIAIAHLKKIRKNNNLNKL